LTIYFIKILSNLQQQIVKNTSKIDWTSFVMRVTDSSEKYKTSENELAREN